MKLVLSRLRIVLMLIVVLVACPTVRAGGERKSWKPDEARTNLKELIDQLLDQQHDDGGWSLSSLGTWVRSDDTAQESDSDGYATGLVLHVLQIAGVPKDDVKIVKGLDWLKSNQSATGAWRGLSVNKERDPASHSGKFMSDAATAFAVLALSH